MSGVESGGPTNPPPRGEASYEPTLDVQGGKTQVFESVVLDHIQDQRQRWADLEGWLKKNFDEDRSWKKAVGRQLRTLHDSKVSLESELTDVKDTLLVGAVTGAGEDLGSARDVAMATGVKPRRAEITAVQVAMFALAAIAVNDAILIALVLLTRR